MTWWRRVLIRVVGHECGRIGRIEWGDSVRVRWGWGRCQGWGPGMRRVGGSAQESSVVDLERWQLGHMASIETKLPESFLGKLRTSAALGHASR